MAPEVGEFKPPYSPCKDHCSVCGAEASYDGRCGDGPVLTCGCDRGAWINDGRGGYYDNPTGAQAVQGPYIPHQKIKRVIVEYENVEKKK